MKAHHALELVRGFGRNIVKDQPTEPLAKGLAAHIEWEEQKEGQGRRLFQDSVALSVQRYRDVPPSPTRTGPPADAPELDEISTELEECWQDVIRRLGKKKGIHAADLQELLVSPTAEVLERIVRQAQDKLEADKVTRGGVVRQWFHKVASRIYDHEYLLEMLPKGDKYTSILTGGLLACVKASMEHQNIADQISECLEKLSDQTFKLWRVMQAPDCTCTEYMKTHISKFYSTLFSLLVKVLQEWLLSRWDRLKSSLGPGFRTTIQKFMADLAYHTAEVERDSDSTAIHETNKDLRDVKNDIKDMRDVQDALLNIGAWFQAALVGSATDSSSTLSSGLLHGGPTGLPNHAFAFNPYLALTQIPQTIPIQQQRGVSQALASTPVAHQQASREESRDPTHLPPEKASWTPHTVRGATAWMSYYPNPGRTTSLTEQARYISADRLVYHRLLQWTTSLNSETLWVEGPATMCEPSNNTLTTAFIAHSFGQLGIPVLQYFCFYNPRQWRSFSCEEELLNLAYALIYQLALVLPEQVETGDEGALLIDLSTERLSRLTPHAESLPEAIDLLGDMLAVGPRLFAILIDGLQLLDREEESDWYKACLRRFLETLGNAGRGGIGERTPKIWLSTDGHSWALQDLIRDGWFDGLRADEDSTGEPLRLRSMDVAGASD